MRKIYYLLIFVFSFSVLSAQEKLTKEEKARREKNIQAGNPFAKYGYKAKVATLSKGKYLEFHDLDSIVTIGTSRWHVDNKKIVGDIVIDSLNVDAQPIGDAPGMWMSPDPLSEEFPSYSPYAYAMNNPVNMVDPDGRFPYPVTIRSFHPSASFGGFNGYWLTPALGRNFGGDGHGFSLNSSATARVTHTVTADPQKGTANYTGRGKGGTTSNLSTHPYMYPKADVPDGYLGGVQSGNNSVSFTTGYNGTNPLAFGPTPDIDVDAMLKLTQTGNILNISGKVNGDNFPNTEAFITDPTGQEIFLGTDVRAGGQDQAPTILFGPATENIMNINLNVRTNAKTGKFEQVQVGNKWVTPAEYNKPFIKQNPNPTD